MEGWTPILYWVSKRNLILNQSKVNLLWAPFRTFKGIWCSVCPSLCLSNSLSVHSCESISLYHSTHGYLRCLPLFCLSVCSSAHLFVTLSIPCLSTNLCVRVFVCLPVFLFICTYGCHSVYPLFVYQSVYSSVRLFTHPSVYQSACLCITIHPYVCLSVCCTSSKLSACSTYVCMSVCVPGILTINICCRIYIAVQKIIIVHTANLSCLPLCLSACLSVHLHTYLSQIDRSMSLYL
jgi:hypothetical protein